jgi:two-component system cell cycle sensor histidine kinase PleC
MQSLDAPAGGDQTRATSDAGAEQRPAAADGFRALKALTADRQNSALALGLLDDYGRTRSRGTILSVGLLVAAGLAATAWIAPILAGLWILPALALHVGLAALCLMSVASATAMPASRAPFALVALETACGLAWATLLALVAAQATTDPTIFLLTTALIATAYGTSRAASLPAAAFAAGAPITLAAVTLFAMRGTPLDLALAGLCLAAGIGSLAHANRLHQIKRAWLDTDRSNHRLTKDLDAARAKTTKALRAAEEANLAKSRFLATMNHELRTPLNAILGFSEVMKNEVLGPMENRTYREYASDIHASGGHLLSLVSEILELSGFEAGRYELREEPVQLARLAQDCEAFVRSRSESRALKLSLAVEPDLPPLFADARAARQAVINLLSNAIKFTAPGGEIEILVGWTAGGGQYVSVRDTGRGIPADELRGMIAAFEQSESTIRRAEQGSGMGLAIVNAIAGLHGAIFELRSTLGRGTEATLCFPRDRVMEPRAVETPRAEVAMVSPIIAEPAASGGEVVPLRSAG